MRSPLAIAALLVAGVGCAPAVCDVNDASGCCPGLAPYAIFGQDLSLGCSGGAEFLFCSETAVVPTEATCLVRMDDGAIFAAPALSAPGFRACGTSEGTQYEPQNGVPVCKEGVSAPYLIRDTRLATASN